MKNSVYEILRRIRSVQPAYRLRTGRKTRPLESLAFLDSHLTAARMRANFERERETIL